MKNLLEILPKLLELMPGIIQFLKYIPVVMILVGIGYGVFYWSQNYKDPYKCFNNEIYEQLRVDSDVYMFKGGYCIDGEKK